MCSVGTESVSQAIFKVMALKHIGFTTLTFLGHVTSSVTSAIDSPYAISYWCPIFNRFRDTLPQIPFARITAQKERHTPQVILYSVPCNVLHWTDKIPNLEQNAALLVFQGQDFLSDHCMQVVDRDTVLVKYLCRPTDYVNEIVAMR